MASTLPSSLDLLFLAFFFMNIFQGPGGSNPARDYLDRLSSSPLRQRLIRAAAWSFVGAGLSRTLGLASSIFVARILHKEVFGELGIIQSTSGMFAAFAGLGLGLTATKYVAEFRDRDPRRAGQVIQLSRTLSVAVGGVMTVVVLVSSGWLSAHVLGAPMLRNPLRVGAMLLILGALNDSQLGALAGLEAFKRIALLALWSGLLTFPLTVGGAFVGGLNGALWGLVGVSVAGCLLGQVALRRETASLGLPLINRGLGAQLKLVWSFALPAALAGIVTTSVTWACNAMLVNSPGGYAEMGVFSAANQWRSAILFIPATIGTAALPILANLRGEKDRFRYGKVLRYNVLVSASLAALVALPVVFLAPHIMASYGEGFRGGGVVLTILAVTAILMAAAAVIGQAIASLGRMWAGLWLNSVWAIVLLATAWQLIGWGARGLAIATAVAYGVHLVTVSAYTRFALPTAMASED